MLWLIPAGLHLEGSACARELYNLPVAAQRFAIQRLPVS
jgi:hypothetical protein